MEQHPYFLVPHNELHCADCAHSYDATEQKNEILVQMEAIVNANSLNQCNKAPREFNSSVIMWSH